MSIESRSVAVYAIDCSKTMGIPIDFTTGTGESATTSRVTPLELMVKYVKVKIAQRMMRDLKTTPIAVITFATSKTKNILTTRQKEQEGENYDKEDDPYRGFAETISFSYVPEGSMLVKLDQVKAGTGLDVTAERQDAGDLLNGIVVALKTLDQQPKCKNFENKEVVLLTDGESQTDWGEWEEAAKNMVDCNISLTVIGMGFDHEGDDELSFKKSPTKLENEAKLRQFVDYLDSHDIPSLYATANEALVSITEPKVKEVKSTAVRTAISFGDPEVYPSRSIEMFVDIKKSVTPGTMQSMASMSLKNFERGKSNQSQATQSQSYDNHGASTSTGNPNTSNQSGPPQPLSDFARSFYMGELGMTLEEFLATSGMTQKGTFDKDIDLMVNQINRQSVKYYRPEDKLPVDETKVDEEDDEEVKDVPPEPVAPETELDEAYRYGGTNVAVSRMMNGAGTLKGLKTGMQILAFLRSSSIPYELRMGDLLEVTASPGQTGSQLMFSAFINGMVERKSVAIVRYVGKPMKLKGIEKYPDPKIGILSPCLDLPGHEFCYWAQMPFSEDISELTVPALTYVRRKDMMIESDHKYLPTPAMDEAMDEFVDAMNLMEDGDLDEVTGEPTPWFSPSTSYSPAIHNVINTVIARAVSKGPLPPIPDSITRYANPPLAAVQRAEESRLKMIKLFGIAKVPPKPKKVAKSKADYFPQAEDLAASGSVAAAFGASPPRFGSGLATTSSKPNNRGTLVGEDDDEDDEMEVDDDESSKIGSRVARKEDDDDDDSGPETQDEDEDEEMSIIEPIKVGGVFKSADRARFERILKDEGADAAIAWMFTHVWDLVLKSFGNAKYAEGITGIQTALEIAKKHHAGESYNDGLRDLAHLVLKSSSSRDFGKYLQDAGFTLLDVSEEDAATFTRSLN